MDLTPPVKKIPLLTNSQQEIWTKVTNWIRQELQKGFVPRKLDVLDYMRVNNLKISGGRSKVGKLLRLMPEYHSTSHQQRRPLRTFKYRPIIVSDLGHLQADIGYFPLRRDYETPKTFQHGFLAVRDILSRYVYFIVLRGPKSKTNLVRVLERLISEHNLRHNYPILSISFDQEPGMLSKTVQEFLKTNNIAFRVFDMSRNKAFMAEALIKQLRIDYERIRINSKEKWWQILENKLQQNFNSKTIYIRGKSTGFAPKDITSDNVDQFLNALHRIAPAAKFAVFSINKKWVKFKFQLNDIVQPTVVATSSKALGEKSSQLSIRPEMYQIVKQLAILHQDNFIRPGYRCKNLQNSKKFDVFDEQDLVLALVDQE